MAKNSGHFDQTLWQGCVTCLTYLTQLNDGRCHHLHHRDLVIRSTVIKGLRPSDHAFRVGSNVAGFARSWVRANHQQGFGTKVKPLARKASDCKPTRVLAAKSNICKPSMRVRWVIASRTRVRCNKCHQTECRLFFCGEYEKFIKNQRRRPENKERQKEPCTKRDKAVQMPAHRMHKSHPTHGPEYTEDTWELLQIDKKHI